MFSIGILGFLVWSLFFSVALSYREVGVTNLAVCWNSLTLLGTFSCKNLSSYTQSAGNRNFSINTSTSETICEISCQNFNTFFKLYSELGFTSSISEHWLSWFVGFAEGDGAIQTYHEGKRVRFVLTQKEKDILYKIQFKFNIGVVKHFPQGKSGKNNDFYR